HDRGDGGESVLAEGTELCCGQELFSFPWLAVVSTKAADVAARTRRTRTRSCQSPGQPALNNTKASQRTALESTKGPRMPHEVANRFLAMLVWTRKLPLDHPSVRCSSLRRQ